jgi:hypothetical protein
MAALIKRPSATPRGGEQFNELRHPVVYTPGDNEWFDCWEPHSGIVFATAHMMGSANGMKHFPARTSVDDAAARRRTEVAAAWMRETFSAAKASNASAVVIAFHGNAFDIEPQDREPFQPFLFALQEEVERFQRPVLVTHGDDHVFTCATGDVRTTSRASGSHAYCAGSRAGRVEAGGLSQRYTARFLARRPDLLHVAAAHLALCDTFVSADDLVLSAVKHVRLPPHVLKP